MPHLLGPLEVLNSRELAALIWLVLVSAYVAWKAEGLGASLLAVLRAARAPKLVLVYGVARHDHHGHELRLNINDVDPRPLADLVTSLCREPPTEILS